MLYIQEALKQLNKLIEENADTEIIKINVYVQQKNLSEKLPSGKVEDKYDEQTLEDWYDFASNVESIIDNFCNLVNISFSHNEDSLSEYIDFYSYKEDGSQKDYLLNLRLSDHPQTYNAKRFRKYKVKSKYPKYQLKSILVNNKEFDSYEDALIEVRKLLSDQFFNSND